MSRCDSQEVLNVCYESMRADYLTAGGKVHRLGLALFLRRGMAEWTATWSATAMPTVSTPAAVRCPATTARDRPDELVMVLAGMASNFLEDGGNERQRAQR